MNRIIFRADANAQIGLGHVTRSLALADMLKNDFNCLFLIQTPNEYQIKEINKVCHSFIELPESKDYLDEAQKIVQFYIQKEDIVVLDGYHFKTEYQQIIKSSGCKLVCIDDMHNYHFIADSIINHSEGVNENDYSKDKHTKIYLGTRYALLRREFIEEANKDRKIETAQNVFICFGGSDYLNITEKALNACLNVEALNEIHIVVGNAYNYIEKLKNSISLTTKHKIFLYSNLSANEIINLIKKCQIAIAPASGILNELCCVKIGIIGGFYIDNQIDTNNGFEFKNCIISVGDYNILNETELSQKIKELLHIDKINYLIENQKKLSYKDSFKNCKKIFNKLLLESKLNIRTANKDDLMTYFLWANDPEVRINSYNPEEIKLLSHHQWFLSKIEAQNCEMYLFELENISVAQIRFEIENKVATINYSISKEFRGKGLGSIVLEKGINALLCKRNNIQSIVGFVQQSNTASIKAFESLSFKYSNEKEVPYPNSFKFIKEISNDK